MLRGNESIGRKSQTRLLATRLCFRRVSKRRQVTDCNLMHWTSLKSLRIKTDDTIPRGKTGLSSMKRLLTTYTCVALRTLGLVIMATGMFRNYIIPQRKVPRDDIRTVCPV
jgi:hypothetical protein